jgi:hypothetical protein
VRRTALGGLLAGALLAGVPARPLWAQREHVVPAGTLVPIRFLGSVVSGRERPGALVVVQTMAALAVDSCILVAPFRDVLGRVTVSRGPRHGGGAGALDIRFDTLILDRAHRLPLDAVLDSLEYAIPRDVLDSGLVVGARRALARRAVPLAAAAFAAAGEILALPVALLALLVLGVGALALLPAWRPPPPPQQPMGFSHKVHAGDNRIGCSACHAFADRGPVAGLPSMARCRGCHKFVKEDPDRPQLDQALKPLVAWLRQKPPQPIPWVRVYRLPDHVAFTHQRHVVSGVRCQECHGEVERMEQLGQATSLLMGWCLECHRRKQAEKPAERAHLTECLTCHK